MSTTDPPTPKPKRPARGGARARAASKPSTAQAAASKPSTAQAEFANYKDRLAQQTAMVSDSSSTGTAGASAPFASPLPASGIPAWSLQPPEISHHPIPGPPPNIDPGAFADDVGTTIRLGVCVLNTALSGGLRVLTGIGEAIWRDEDCGCDECRGVRAYDCCTVLASDCGCGCGGECGCGCCEPSVGSCC